MCEMCDMSSANADKVHLHDRGLREVSSSCQFGCDSFDPINPDSATLDIYNDMVH